MARIGRIFAGLTRANWRHPRGILGGRPVKNGPWLSNTHTLKQRERYVSYSKRGKNMENQIQVSIGWGTLSLIVAGIAQGKNRSGLAWWLLSLIFGPFALLILL